MEEAITLKTKIKATLQYTMHKETETVGLEKKNCSLRLISLLTFVGTNEETYKPQKNHPD